MWNQLQLKTTAEHVEHLSDLLLQLGAEAVTLLDAKDQPLLEPGPGETPLWNEVWVSGLFPADAIIQDLIEKLKQCVSSEPFPDYRLVPLEDENWTRAWLNHFHPMQFGARLWVCPTEKIQSISNKDAAIVLLDPGLAFGTGTHPTTALCLEWLDQNLQVDSTVMDYGCGSGILAIAALKLGAKKAWAIDNDPQALIATKENAVRNHIDLDQLCIAGPDAIIASDGDNKAKFIVDTILANILAQPLIQLAPIFAQTLKPGGNIVLSGILPDQADAIITPYKKWFDDFEMNEKEGWVRIVAKKLLY